MQRGSQLVKPLMCHAGCLARETLAGPCGLCIANPQACHMGKLSRRSRRVFNGNEIQENFGEKCCRTYLSSGTGGTRPILALCMNMAKFGMGWQNVGHYSCLCCRTVIAYGAYVHWSAVLMIEVQPTLIYQVLIRSCFIKCLFCT